MDVASASFQVGYEDPSYFSREYKKLFGVPPLRDIAKLRSNLANNLLDKITERSIKPNLLCDFIRLQTLFFAEN